MKALSLREHLYDEEGDVHYAALLTYSRPWTKFWELDFVSGPDLFPADHALLMVSE